MPTSEQPVLAVADDTENPCARRTNGRASRLSRSVPTFAMLIEPCTKAAAEGDAAITKTKFGLTGDHSGVRPGGRKCLGFFMCFLTSLSYAATLPIKVQVQSDNGS